MSLLMEALRKAEEAKSRAAQEEKENKDRSAAPEAPAEAASRTEIRQEPPPGIQSRPEYQQGPVIINPDPDEEETLASHAESGTDFSGVPMFTLEPRDEDFAAAPKGEDETGAESADFNPLADDEGLSLLQSSYFNRTHNTGGASLADDEDEPDNSYDFGDAVDIAGQDTDEPDTLPEPEAPALAGLRVPPAADINRPVRPDPAASLATARKAEEKSREQQKRSNAGALFQAKEETQRRRRQQFMSIAAVLLVIPVAGIAYWFYTSYTSTPQMQFNVPQGGLANRGFLGGDNQVAQDTQPVSPETAGELLASVADATQNVDAAAGMGETSVEPLIAAGGDSGITESLEAQTEPTTVPLPVPPPGAAQAPPATAAEQAPPVQQPVQTVVAQASQPATPPRSDENVLSFSRRDVRPVLNPALNAAYESYQQGDYDAAGRLYQQVLRSEPNNRDAMLGLASVYVKQANIPMSQTLYARLLELNPRDAVARAGLLDTSRGDDPLRQETELKAMISAYPSVAPLSFALGNLYATQNRWNEAQGAYFDALLSAKSAINAGPVSPDYAFNLAVSLERLNQQRAALEYYREAAEFARNSAPGFSMALLNQRLDYLEQRLR